MTKDNLQGQNSQTCASRITQGAPMVANKFAVFLSATLTVFLTGSAPTHAEDIDRSKDVRALGRCAECVLQQNDFSGRNLMGIDFTSADLKLIKFDGSNMNLAVFENAVLTNTSFAGVNLRGASFVGARLINVSLKEADLQGAVFDGAILEGTDLDAARLCNTQTASDEIDNSDCDVAR
ncbi:pentapeptide repeat-containing protein [Sulfitobacter sp. BDSS02]|nr:pentapeptide repeat-containing protein [Sulfitobacter sp. BDSS02]MBR9852071.1 pentapeptide repeat-containing protein [Paracoccaceae bacterium]